MPLPQLFVYEPIKKYPEVFNIRLTWIPTFQVNMTNTCRSEANQLKLFVFLTICGSKSNNHSTLMHVTWITWIIIRLITWKWLNIIRFSAECYSIFASRSNTSTLNHQFFALPTIWLRHHSFGIRYGDESQSGTPLHRYLKSIYSFVDFNRQLILWDWGSHTKNGIWPSPPWIKVVEQVDWFCRCSKPNFKVIKHTLK